MSRTRRRMMRHAWQAYNAGKDSLSRYDDAAAAAMVSFREVINYINTIHEQDGEGWQDEDVTLMLGAYRTLMEFEPETLDNGRSNPAYVALQNEVRQAMSEMPAITSPFCFITKLRILTIMAVTRDSSHSEDLHDSEDSAYSSANDVVLGGELATFALDQGYVDQNCGEIFAVLRAMHEAMAGQNIDVLLSESQREDLALCYDQIAYTYLQILNHDEAFAYLQKAINLRMGSKEIDKDTFSNIKDMFEAVEHSFPAYESEFKQICWFAQLVFTDRNTRGQSATLESFVNRSSYLLNRMHSGLSKQCELFGTVLDIIYARMKAGAFDLMSNEYFPDNAFRDAMLEPRNQQYFLEVREKFQSANAMFERLGRDPSILFSQELEIQRLRQRVAELEKRLPQPMQPSAGGMFKQGQVRERDSDKDLNPIANKKYRLGE